MQLTELDSLIQSVKHKPLPSAAPLETSLEASVLRAIRHRPAKEGKPSLDWVDILLAPRMAAFCLFLVLASSFCVTVLTSHAFKNTADYPTVAAKALDFDSFYSTDLLAFSTPSQW